MQAGAEFASKICGVEGAFGYGTPIAGRIIDNRNNFIIAAKKNKTPHE